VTRLFFSFFFVALFGLMFQASIIKTPFPSAISPDLIVVLAVILGLRYRTLFGLLGAFSLGLLSDFASGQYLGPNAAGAVSAFLLAGVIANRVYADKGLALFIIVSFCSLAKILVVLGMISGFLVKFSFDSEIAFKIFIEAVFSGAIAPLVVRVVLGIGVSSRKRVHSRSSNQAELYAHSPSFLR
jgi:rod shape-determining protein MreD